MRACVVQLDGYEPAGKAEPALSRIEQLKVVMNDRDAQLVPVQRALLESLASDPSDDATALLLDLAGDPRTAPELAAAAEAKISGRRNGADALLRELARHYDYVTDVLRPPPVSVIAPALAAIKEPRGARSPGEHLFDPGDTDEDIHAAAKALEALATAAELPAIARFFAAYRATTDDRSARRRGRLRRGHPARPRQRRAEEAWSQRTPSTTRPPPTASRSSSAR